MYTCYNNTNKQTSGVSSNTPFGSCAQTETENAFCNDAMCVASFFCAVVAYISVFALCFAKIILNIAISANLNMYAAHDA